MRSRVILFGGSFDPIHNGHLAVAEAAIKQLNASACWLIPAFDAPLKDRVLTPFHHRVNMIKMAIDRNDHLFVNQIEATLPLPNYTVVTLQTLISLHPQFDFVLLIGADQAVDFKRWKDPEVIRSLVEIAVYPRIGYAQPEGFIWIHHDLIDISSTAIRNGSSTNTPAEVLRYMMSKNLYTEQIVAAMISEKRMAHVLRVTQLTRQLALRYGCDADKAVMAGLFHDAVKQWPQERLLRWMRLYRPQLLHLHPAIWHAFVGADVLKHSYHIRDRSVLQAIAHHVEGNSSDLLAKILYVADKIEPGRKYDTDLLIQAAFNDIHKTVRIVKTMQAQHLGKEISNDIN
ncbi:MAG: nicotinate (nicotinamide) nucleotide adenylyltransferase [Erysipelotrichaceae bacterium]|nr:nicotinate (nicotinamide) nucleotide adenylyltransferase [Erysipelotrichaceae bacterium]